VICVVLHRSPDHSPLATVLQSYTAIPVTNRRSRGLSPGTVTVAPAGYHLMVGDAEAGCRAEYSPLAQYERTQGVRAHLTLDAPVAHSGLAGRNFCSAAELARPVIAVLLSCANEDGVAGCAAVKAAGGRVVLQDPPLRSPVAVNAAMRTLAPTRWRSGGIGDGFRRRWRGR